MAAARARFSVGDMVVYPEHGVARVIGFQQFQISTGPVQCYVLEMANNWGRIMVPVGSEDHTGLRALITPKEAHKIISMFSAPASLPPSPAKSKKSYQQLQARLAKGDTLGVATLLHELYERNNRGPLSFGERRVLEKVRKALSEELSLALGRPAHEIVVIIEDLFKRKPSAAARAAQARCSSPS